MSEAVQNLDNSSGTTVYEMAFHSGHYRVAQKFLQEQDAEKVPLSFPTMLAWEDSTLVGVLSTAPRKDMIQAGPMVLKKDHSRRFTALRLMEAYESLLQGMGIVTYTIFVDYASDKLMDLMLKLPMTDVIGEDAEGVLFARRLKQNATQS